MKPLDIKYKYLILFFIIVFISINSVNATESNTDNSGDLSSNYVVSIDRNNLNVNLDYSNSIDNLNDNSLSSSASSTKTVLSSNGLTMYYGTNSSVVGYLKTSSGKAIKDKTVKITINGNTYTKTTDSYGKVSLKIITLKPGVYSTKFSFAASSGYAASSCTVNVNVKKLPTTITASNLVVNYNTVGKLIITLKDNSNKVMSGKSIKFTINNKTYTKTTNSSGKATLDIKLNPNTYSCSISYAGDSINNASCKTVKVTVNKLSTKIIIDDLSTKSGYSFVTCLRDANNNILTNKNIQFSIEGIVYTGTTDGYGKVSFIIPSLDCKTYNATLNFIGDNYYSPSSASFKVRVHEEEVDTSNIKNQANNIVDYIERNHKLPEYVYISNEKISLSQYLNLISLDIININNNVSSPIFLDSVSSSKTSESLKEGSLTRDEYIKIVNSVVLACNSGFAPRCVNSSLGNIGFNSLIYIFSNIIKSYNVFGVIPESIHIYPWSLVSNNKTVFINYENILEESLYLRDYVESKHSLPSTIKINSTNSLVSINLAQFLKLELDTLVQLPYNSIQSLILKSYSMAPDSSETISQCSFDINYYYDFAIRIIDFYNKNNRAPNYVTTNKGNLGFESIVYTYSQILVSISKFSALPSYINIVPWSVVKNKATVFVSMDNIFEIASIVEDKVVYNHSLENSLSCDGFKTNLNQFLYLETCAIENINNCLFQSVILKSFSNPPNPSESLKEGVLSKNDYLKIASNIKNFLVDNGRLPNYASSSLGNINYKNSIFIFSEILNYFNLYKNLPSNILINPWSILSNKNTLIFTPDQIVNASYYIRNYVEANHNTPNTLIINGTSIDKYQLLKLEITTLNLISDNYIGYVILDKYNYKYSSDSLTSGSFNKEEYLNIGKLIEYDMIHSSFTTESTVLGNINIDNALYLYSQILTSYDNNGVLPEFINVKPWSLISNKNTKFISIDNIRNVSKYLKDYIETNNTLPNYVNIDGNNVDMSNLAYILAISLKMIDGNLYANIPLDNFYFSNNCFEDISPHTISSDSYLAIASDFVQYMDKNKAVPSYLSTEFGKIRYESLILLFTTIFDYMDSGEFLDNTIILPWNLITSSKFFTIEEITNASYDLRRYIELNHVVPNYILINGYNVSIITYFELASEAILNINGDLYSSLLARNYSLNDFSYLNEFFNNRSSSFTNENISFNSEDSYYIDMNKPLSMYLVEYIYLINQLNEYFNNNLLESNNLLLENNFNYSYIDFNAMVFLMSKILSSYKYYNTLPDFLDLISWNYLSNSIFLNQEDIINSSFYLKDYVELNHKLPNNIMIGNNSLNIVQVLDVYTSCIYNINFNIYQSVILREFEGDYNDESSFENIISGDLDYYEYISLIFDLKELFDKGIVVSNLSDISLGDNIGFNSLLMMEALILNNYSYFTNLSNLDNTESIKNSDCELVGKVTIIPWIVISNPNMIYNYRNCKVFNSIQEAIDDVETLDNDYIGVSKSNIYENIVINKSIYLSPVTGYNVSFIGNISNICYSYSNIEDSLYSDIPLIYLYSNSSIIEGFNFISEGNGIEIIGSSNTISNCIFNCQNGVIIKGNENYIGFNEFNGPCGIIYGDYNTIESNKINSYSYGIKLVDSINSTILGNIIHSTDYSLYISNASSNINFNSLISDKGLYINSNRFIDLNNNWWGLNNPYSLEYFNNLKYNNYNFKSNSSDLSNIYNTESNISCDSWLILSLDDFVDYSTPSNGTYNVVLIGDVRYNNLHQDLSMTYTIDNLNMNFTTNQGKYCSDLSIDGECIYIINSSNPSDVYVTLTLDNETITKLVYLPSNNSSGITNTQSGKYYYSIQDAIDDEDTINGDTILLNRGIFNENIFIYKNIKLEGNGTVYLNSVNDSKALITVFSNNAVIKDLFISADEDNYAISNYGINTNITNCIISDSMVGLYCMGSTNCSVINCSFINNEYGSYLSYTSNINFINCSFIENSYGIFGIEDDEFVINNSKFTSCWISLDLVNVINSFITNNEFNDSYLGLELINNNDSSILNNLFCNNIVGCSFYNSTTKISSNRFVDNILGDSASFDNDIELQRDMWSCGPASLVSVLHKLGFMEFNQLDIINVTNVDNKGTSLYNLLSYLRNNSINKFPNACCLETNSSNLSPLDIVLLDIDGNYHYSVIWNISDEWVLLADSTAGLLNVSRFSFDNIFSSYVLVLDSSNRVGRVLNSQEIFDIYGEWYAEAAWTWLNTPIFSIPGYGELDDNYGVLGQSIKLAGWFLLGIDDNGGLTPLDITLDALSICSGFGLAERFGVSGSILVKNFATKPMLNKFVGEELLRSTKTIFNNYKTILSILNNPVKFSLNKLTTKALKLYEDKYIANFAINYLNNNFCSLANVFGISESYLNAKDNLLLLSNFIKSDDKSLNDVIHSTKSTISSSITNTNIALKAIYKSTITISNKVTKTVKAIKKTVASISKSVNTKVKTTVKSVKTKVKSSNVYKATVKTYNTVKTTAVNVVSTVKKTIINTTKRITSTLNTIVKKLKFW